MTKNYNIMLDLETLGTDADSVILSIGAVIFDDHNTYEELNIVLDVDAQVEKGRTIDERTVKWWQKQKDASWIFNAPKTPCDKALKDFQKLFFTRMNKEKRNIKIYANPISFDVSLIQSLFKTFNIQHPWRHWEVMDLRTMKYLYGHRCDIKNIPFTGIKHDALDDAKHQVKVAQELIKVFRQDNRK